jgi:hypothetical protein
MSIIKNKNKKKSVFERRDEMRLHLVDRFWCKTSSCLTDDTMIEPGLLDI